MNAKIVRLINRNGGPCTVLGPLIKETKRMASYRCRAMLTAFIPRRLAHLKPCPSCQDHPHSYFSKLTIFNGYG